MQAITTKYLPTTNLKPSRIKASCERGSLTMSYDHETRTGEALHRLCAEKLCAKFAKEDELKYGTNKNPWLRPFVTGCIKGDYVHVFDSYFGNQVLIEFADSNDREQFISYRERALKQDGTVSGLYAGLMCSAVKRSKI